jgi:PPOX class probable F420-dependent enzyme
MAKVRDKIRMSAEEAAAFLDSCRNLQVATLDKTGAPHLTTVWFARDGDGVIFETYGTSQKVVNLRRDPRLAALCEQGASYDELRGVSIQGRAEVIDAEPRLSSLMRRLVDRNHPGLSAEQLEEITRQMVRKRVVVRVQPETVMSWDHRKLAQLG